ncbi:helix-turn-helix domain-containing protein [Sinomicrobium kalidii]|uniref:helix-turn-helix domain-containing protein n=1 Tax=Sinomicrobium kalidii TaxID=2900738 RepID=UPI001E356572|nr:helix-turn-helix domain-containing protein [Sinomicrobium kalidii]UGU14434.1 helix-turn-helix domain-containing protein [Sinomicrobium kalidii]
MNNPFDTLQTELSEIKGMLTELLNQPKEDLSNKFYTINEAAGILKVDRQTVRNHIEKGHIQARRMKNGSRILIAHTELFDSLNEIKSLKYKR